MKDVHIDVRGDSRQRANNPALFGGARQEYEDVTRCFGERFTHNTRNGLLESFVAAGRTVQRFHRKDPAATDNDWRNARFIAQQIGYRDTVKRR
jgi:hypothetical protein